jgi:hypothetical protein
MKFTHAPTVVEDTPEGALLVSLRQALVHAHCRCTAEIGRVVSTPRGFWWTPSLESSDEPAIAVELDDTDADDAFVEGWCPTHRARRIAVRDLLVQARRAQKTGQRRHMWLDGS